MTYLDGGAGANKLTGGKGNDIYVLSNDADTLIELAGEGIDEVRIGVDDFTLGANLENLTLTGALSIDGLGNALANVMAGNSGNNRLNGLAGNDTLSGGAGNDLVEGGLGNDLMKGGTGNDTYIVDSLADKVIETANEGRDLVVTALASYTLGANIEDLDFGKAAGPVTGIGNTLANTSSAASMTTNSTGERATTCWTAAPAKTRCWAEPATTSWSAMTATTC